MTASQQPPAPDRLARRAPACALLALALAGPGSLATAQAACQTAPFQFRPTQSGAVQVDVVCDRQGGRMGVRPRADAVPASATIVGYPRHGEIAVNSRLTYTYRPHRGFRGQDEFSVRVCAIVEPLRPVPNPLPARPPAQPQPAQGCTTLVYAVLVK